MLIAPPGTGGRTTAAATLPPRDDPSLSRNLGWRWDAAGGARGGGGGDWPSTTRRLEGWEERRRRPFGRLRTQDGHAVDITSAFGHSRERTGWFEDFASEVSEWLPTVCFAVHLQRLLTADFFHADFHDSRHDAGVLPPALFFVHIDASTGPYRLRAALPRRFLDLLEAARTRPAAWRRLLLGRVVAGRTRRARLQELTVLGARIWIRTRFSRCRCRRRKRSRALSGHDRATRLHLMLRAASARWDFRAGSMSVRGGEKSWSQGPRDFAGQATRGRPSRANILERRVRDALAATST